MRTTASPLLTGTALCPCTRDALAGNYQCEIHFTRNMGAITHDGWLCLLLTSTQSHDRLVFQVSDGYYSLSQSIHDPTIQDAFNLPASVALSGSEGE